MEFQLDQKLREDCIELGHLKLSKLLLMNDSQYPWLILVPQQTNAKEIYQLTKDEQISLMMESNLVSRALEQLFQPDKINIASIGNIVSQLHMHHVARFKSDVTWPAPVWGAKPAVPYEADALNEVCEKMREAMSRYLKK